MSSKGPHVLFKALIRLHQLGIPFHCECAGGVLQDDGLRPFISLLQHGGIQSYVSFLGQLDRYDLREFYARNQILVFPSIHPEGFGIVQVEAMAAGLLVK